MKESQKKMYEYLNLHYKSSPQIVYLNQIKNSIKSYSEATTSDLKTDLNLLQERTIEMNDGYDKIKEYVKTQIKSPEKDNKYFSNKIEMSPVYLVTKESPRKSNKRLSTLCS